MGSHRLKHADQTGVHRTRSEVIAIIIIIIIIIFNIMYSHLSRAFFAWVLRTGGFSGELKKLRESQSGFPFPMKGGGVIKLMLSSGDVASERTLCTGTSAAEGSPREPFFAAWTVPLPILFGPEARGSAGETQKTALESTQNRPKICPKSTQHLPKIGFPVHSIPLALALPYRP